MIADHGKANQQLDELAQAAKVPQPGGADEQHKAMLQYLEKPSGRDFDLAYIRGQVTEHQMAVQLFEWEIGSGQAIAQSLCGTSLAHGAASSGASAIQTELAASPSEHVASGPSRPERKPTMAR
jgi:predicted outer membrane protein